MEFTVQYHSAPDAWGRRRFTLEWDGWNPVTNEPMRRGQVFFADPSTIKREGDSWREVTDDRP